MPRTHNTDKVATALLKDQMTAVDGEVEVEVVGVGDGVQSDVVLGVGLTVGAQHDTTYIGGDSIVANISKHCTHVTFRAGNMVQSYEKVLKGSSAGATSQRNCVSLCRYLRTAQR